MLHITYTDMVRYTIRSHDMPYVAPNMGHYHQLLHTQHEDGATLDDVPITPFAPLPNDTHGTLRVTHMGVPYVAII